MSVEWPVESPQNCLSHSYHKISIIPINVKFGFLYTIRRIAEGRREGHADAKEHTRKG